jgi:hypothetical protein
VSRRTTGWALLAWAAAAAVVSAVLAAVSGGSDPWLAALVAAGVLATATLVLLDELHARRRQESRETSAER